jgi:hypothetical protein
LERLAQTAEPRGEIHGFHLSGGPRLLYNGDVIPFGAQTMRREDDAPVSCCLAACAHRRLFLCDAWDASRFIPDQVVKERSSDGRSALQAPIMRFTQTSYFIQFR